MEGALYLGGYTIFRKSNPSHRYPRGIRHQSQHLVLGVPEWPYKLWHVGRPLLSSGMMRFG